MPTPSILYSTAVRVVKTAVMITAALVTTPANAEMPSTTACLGVVVGRRLRMKTW